MKKKKHKKKNQKSREKVFEMLVMVSNHEIAAVESQAKGAKEQASRNIQSQMKFINISLPFTNTCQLFLNKEFLIFQKYITTQKNYLEPSKPEQEPILLSCISTDVSEEDKNLETVKPALVKNVGE